MVRCVWDGRRGGGGLAIKEGSRNKVWVVRRMLISGVVFLLRVKKRSFLSYRALKKRSGYLYKGEYMVSPKKGILLAKATHPYLGRHYVGFQ